MTATAPSAESTQMAQTPDPPPDPPAAPEAAAGAGRRRWAILGDNPLLTALATLAVALLVLAFAQIHNRVDRLEDTMNTEFAALEDTMNTEFAALEDTMNAGFAEQDAKITDLDDTMNAGFAEQDAKIDELDAKIDAIDLKLTALIHELNLKMTALIAALNKTGEVDAAIEGRLLDSEPAADDPGAVAG